MATPSGAGSTLYWRNAASRQVQLWTLNSSGAFASGASLSNAEITTAEANLNSDLNGDGFVAVRLSNTPQGYALTSASQPLIPVTFFGNNASTSNPGNDWSATAVTPSGSGYTLYWGNATNHQAARWSLDASGAYESGVMLSPSQLFSEEAALKHDLNGDGFVSGKSTINGLNLGTTSQGYALQTGNGPAIHVTWTGGNASANNPGQGWVAMGAVASGNGTALYWQNSITQQNARWEISASGAYQSGVFLSPDQLYSEETNLNADLNGDSIIGASFTSIESRGNTTLLRRNDGQAFVEVGGSRSRVTSPFNLGAGDSSSTWQMLAAETVNGQNQILWYNNPGNFLDVWILDGSWSWQSSNSAINPFSATGLGCETSFEVDVNGNGVIG